MRDEGDVGGEPHPLDDRAGDQRRGDDREGPLERHEQHVRDGALRLEPDTVQEDVRQITDPLVGAGERQRIADERPGHADEAERNETHHHRVERVLGAGQPAIEERERWRHQQHQRCRNQHPRGISLIHASPHWEMGSALASESPTVVSCVEQDGRHIRRAWTRRGAAVFLEKCCDRHLTSGASYKQTYLSVSVQNVDKDV